MKNYFFSNLSALNTDLNYAVDAASSLSGYATVQYVQDYVDEHSGGDYLPLSGGNLSGRIYLNTTETHIVGSTCVFTYSTTENPYYESLGESVTVNMSVSLSVENAGQEFLDMLASGEWTGEGTNYTVKAHIEANEERYSTSKSTTVTGTVSFGNGHADGSMSINLDFPEYTENESNLTINEIVFVDNADNVPTIHITYTADWMDYSTQEEYLNYESSWTIDTVSEEVTVNDPFVLSSEIESIEDSLINYLPLSGGTVDWLSVDSANFNVKNLLSASTRADGKMGSLFIGSDIRDYDSGGGKLAPIIIGNDAASYGAGTVGDFSFPNIAIGNDNVVEPNGIVIGGACGRKYEYDLGTGTGENQTDTSIFNPKREDIDLNDLVFLDENGDPLTSFDSGDRITLPDSTGVTITYLRHASTHRWGRSVATRIGGRIKNVWTEDGVLAQNAAFYYLRTGNTGGNIKLHFEPDPINSVDHSAAQGFSIAIGNDTMAGAWISADVFHGWSNPGAIAIGHGSIAKDKGTISLGTGNLIEGGRSIGIGFNANTSAEYAIQLGTGTNSTQHSLQYEDTQIIAKTYDTSLSAWTNPKLNPSLIPDGYATETYVDTKIGDINTILDSINGQII